MQIDSDRRHPANAYTLRPEFHQLIDAAWTCVGQCLSVSLIIQLSPYESCWARRPWDEILSFKSSSEASITAFLMLVAVVASDRLIISSWPSARKPGKSSGGGQHRLFGLLCSFIQLLVQLTPAPDYRSFKSEKSKTNRTWLNSPIHCCYGMSPSCTACFTTVSFVLNLMMLIGMAQE